MLASLLSTSNSSADAMMPNASTANNNGTSEAAVEAPEWMVQFVEFRKRLFLRTVEPVIVALLGPVVDDEEEGEGGGGSYYHQSSSEPAMRIQQRCGGGAGGGEFDTNSYYYDDCGGGSTSSGFGNFARSAVIMASNGDHHLQQQHQHHRRLGFLPEYVSNVNAFKETSMSFATLIMLFVTLSCVFLIFLSCFYHNQKTSPLFISPRRHRLPRLVPPPLPVDGYFSWVKVCFFMSDEEIINRIGYDSLVFLRFHRLALRCIVKMSVFSFVVLLPLNFTGGGHANAQDLKEYVGSLFFTDFLRFTMANVVSGSPRLWVHCFAAYLLTGIVCRELLIEYETFNSIRHRYLLSREPHLRTVLVTNIPRHLRSASKITNYFRHVYPDAVNSVFMCQNLIQLERMIKKRTGILSRIEHELLLLCRSEKRKLYESSSVLRKCLSLRTRMEDCGLVDASQERLARLYAELEELNGSIETEQNRRRRVMKMLDRMEAGEGSADIDYVLASPFFAKDDPSQRRVLGLNPSPSGGSGSSNDNNTSSSGDGGGGAEGAPDGRNSGNQNKAGGVAYHPPNLGGGGDNEHHHQLPRSIPEGNEDADEEAGAGGGGGGGRIGEGGGFEVDNANNNTITPTNNQLRARSPAASVDLQQMQMHAQGMARASAADPHHISDDPGALKGNHKAQTKKRFRRAGAGFAKAKRAIQHYSRFNPVADGVSLLGRPIRSSSEKDLNGRYTHTAPGDKRNHHIEDHINEVTDKAFVVMRTFTAATIAIQSMHSSKPGSMQVSTAPEPRDILWNNIYVSKGARRTRTYLGEMLVLLIIAFYIVPVALISLLVSESALISSSPRLAQLDQASAFFSAAIALVQPLCIVGLQQLLPPLFMLIGQAEGITSFSEVQMRAFSRYFLFQVINIFLVTTIAGSMFDTVSFSFSNFPSSVDSALLVFSQPPLIHLSSQVAIIIDSPESAFEMLGNSLPRMSSFFITFVTIKTFLALGFELVRTMALVQASLRYILFPNATLRTQRTVIMGMRAIDDPGWFPFHKVLAQDMLVVVVSVVFAVVAPLVTLPCALFCLFSRIMWTHHHLYVYESVFESGGQFWPKIFRRFVFGLIIAQMTITGQFILKDARHEAYATIALMFLTYFFLRATRGRYDPTSSTLPLEVATVMDISLQQEEQQEAQRQHQQKQQSAMMSSQPEAPEGKQTSAAQPPSATIEPGSLIGRFNPFSKAYLQPALRANPRARPEQPFPPAQLGPEGSGEGELRSDDSTDEGWQDSGATVRLKSMNQQDRRLINRWWKDQLQSAGKLNMLPVLIGEECGTLTISGASSVDNVELHGQASFPPSSPRSLV